MATVNCSNVKLKQWKYTT